MRGHLFIYYETHDKVAERNARFLEEGGRTWELDKKWSVRLDAPHHPKMDAHVHVMLRGNDVCVINRKGTPSHGTNPAAAPQWVLDKIRQQGLIEQSMLLETASDLARFAIPSSHIERAEYRARWFDILRGMFIEKRKKRLREIVPRWPFKK